MAESARGAPPMKSFLTLLTLFVYWSAVRNITTQLFAKARFLRRSRS
jgi:hypothetical protein